MYGYIFSSQHIFEMFAPKENLKLFSPFKRGNSRSNHLFILSQMEDLKRSRPIVSCLIPSCLLISCIKWLIKTAVKLVLSNKTFVLLHSPKYFQLFKSPYEVFGSSINKHQVNEANLTVCISPDYIRT